MPETNAAQHLRSLGEEISRCFDASPGSELLCALMISVGKDLSSADLKHQWERFTSRNFFSPLILRGSFRRDVRRRGVEYCFFGEIGKVEFKRFEAQALHCLPLALETLAGLGTDFGPIPRSLAGWAYLCYRLAWGFPDRVNYSADDYSLFASLRNTSPSPLSEHSLFEAWEVGSMDFADGIYISKLSRDIRSCSAIGIAAVLSIEQISSEPVAKPRRKREASREARDKWIYEQCETGLIYKSIVSKLSENKFGWDKVESVQRIQQIAKEYAKRNGLPLTPRRGY